MKRTCLLLVLVLITPGLLIGAGQEENWCGSRPGFERTVFLLKERERRIRERPSLRQRQIVRTTDIGEIAVIAADSQTLINPNRFDLLGRKITFTTNSGGGYNIRRGSGTVSGGQGTRLSLQDDDFTAIQFGSGFTFKFYGVTYSSVFINSDGNLTFGSGDNAITDRDVFRVAKGQPRIAVFFEDLNPQQRGTVSYIQSATKFTVIWRDVTQFFNSGTNSNTFQVNLFKNGNIEFIYSNRIDTREPVVGISPGNAAAKEIRLVDFSSITTLNGVKGVVLERFATQQELDFTAVVNQFHETHPKIFDFIVVWTDFPISLGDSAFAFYSPIQNNVRGIGVPVSNFSQIFGSPKIQGFLAMGFLGKYPDNPDQQFLGDNSTLEVFGQEMGHRWLAFPRALISGVVSGELLGRDDAHWNFYMDTDASVMEGNDIRDNGNGTFTTVESNERYSKLDQYMMGLIPPGAVPPFFFVRGPNDRGRAPQRGITFSGTRVNMTVGQIIQSEGPRIPASNASQKKFRLAFVLLSSQSIPRPEDLAKLEMIRTKWQSFFLQKTNGKGRVVTILP